MPGIPRPVARPPARRRRRAGLPLAGTFAATLGRETGEPAAGGRPGQGGRLRARQGPQNVNCSNISGLTPTYAAPELFDGRPSRHRRRIQPGAGLQEMLTGIFPYEGRTMAQLAAQHLHSRPQLDPLPVADRAAIARALSKNPQQRFPSCRAMVEALRETSPLSAPPAKLGVPPAKPVPPGPRRPAVEAGSASAGDRAAGSADTVGERDRPSRPRRPRRLRCGICRRWQSIRQKSSSVPR